MTNRSPDWLISGGELLARERAKSDAFRASSLYVKGEPVSEWPKPKKPSDYNDPEKGGGTWGEMQSIDKARAAVEQRGGVKRDTTPRAKVDKPYREPKP